MSIFIISEFVFRNIYETDGVSSISTMSPDNQECGHFVQIIRNVIR